MTTLPMDRFGGRYALVLAALAVATAAGMRPALAQDAVFQGFFFNACANPVGALAVRCAETPGGGGALASDSQQSLNPSQALSSTEQALTRARELTADLQQRMETLRDEAAERPTVADDDSIFEFGRLSLLFNARGTIFDRVATNRERGYDGHIVGAQVGADYRLTDRFVVGGLVGYDRTRADFDPDQPARNFVPFGSEGGTRAHSVSLSLFGVYNLTDALYLEGTGSYGYTDYTFRRDVVFLETTRTVPQTEVRTVGNTHGHQFSATAGIGYDIYEGAFSLGPYARLNAVRTVVSGFAEEDRTGSGLAMAIGRTSATSLTSVLGVRMSYAFGMPWGVLVPQARVEYEHEFRDRAPSADSVFVLDAAGNVLSLQGDDPDRDFYNLGVGVLAVLPNGWMPFFDYETLQGHRHLSRHRFTAGLRAEF